MSSRVRFDTSQIDHKLAKGDCLIVLSANGSMHVPRGASLLLVKDMGGPNEQQVPVRLESADASRYAAELSFKCLCNDPNCDRVLRLKGKWTGKHTGQEDRK